MEERLVSHIDACMPSASSISTVVATIFAVIEGETTHLRRLREHLSCFVPRMTPTLARKFSACSRTIHQLLAMLYKQSSLGIYLKIDDSQYVPVIECNVPSFFLMATIHADDHRFLQSAILFVARTRQY